MGAIEDDAIEVRLYYSDGVIRIIATRSRNDAGYNDGITIRRWPPVSDKPRGLVMELHFLKILAPHP